MRILHVEVGGSYGGSLRALETYLRHCDRSAMEHAVLFYYATPGAARLAELADVRTLYDCTPGWIREAAPAPGNLRRTMSQARLLRTIQPWWHLCSRIRSVRDLYRAISEIAPDMVHVNNTFTYQAPTLLAARAARIPVVAHARNPVERTLFNRSLPQLARALVACNHGLARDLETWGTAVPIYTCYDGSESAAVDTEVSGRLRRELLGDGTLLAGSLGRLDAQKGYADLIEAARLVCAERPEIRFAIAGAGTLRNRLQELIERSGLGSKVRLCGFRPDPANFLAALDLFVCPSIYEGGPLVLAEAMALRKPVVSTAVGFAPELVKDGAAGHVVRPGDAPGLAAALLRLLEPAADRAVALERARVAALRLCDPAGGAQRLDRCFRACGEGRSVGGRIRPHAA
jgi:glycosyltransferase involved in cell wall biosynthesis